jgi:uncharacterized protein with PQ loop repeat
MYLTTLTPYIGYGGSILLIISFLAQMYLIYQNKQVENISYVFIILQLLVNIVYVIYDILIESYPLVLGNGSISILLILMAFQKYYYTKINNSRDDIELVEFEI